MTEEEKIERWKGVLDGEYDCSKCTRENLPGHDPACSRCLGDVVEMEGKKRSMKLQFEAKGGYVIPEEAKKPEAAEEWVWRKVKVEAATTRQLDGLAIVQEMRGFAGREVFVRRKTEAGSRPTWCIDKAGWTWPEELFEPLKDEHGAEPMLTAVVMAGLEPGRMGGIVITQEMVAMAGRIITVKKNVVGWYGASHYWPAEGALIFAGAGLVQPPADKLRTTTQAGERVVVSREDRLAMKIFKVEVE